MVHHRQQILTATDGHNIHVQTWEPAAAARCIIQVLHGLGEYADRYARFAETATERGYVVCAHDHRGHGIHADDSGYFSPKNGWRKVCADAQAVNNSIRESFSNLPVVMLGHSMGSYIAQSFAMHYGARLDGLILSASTWPSRFTLLPAIAIAHIEAWRVGNHRSSKLLDKLGFGNFNRRFEPARKDCDRLSRDEVEVDRYVADPLCGGPYSSGLWLDLLGGLFEISSDHALTRIPSDLPVLITGGAADPAGGDAGMSRLALHYAQTLHQRLKVKIYPDGRHEMLNEINRDEVTADWLAWIDATTRNARSG